MWSDVKRQHRRDRIAIECSCGSSRRDGHYGWAEILERARRLGSKLVILSGVGTRTEAKLTIPARAAHEYRRGRGRFQLGRLLGKAQKASR